MKILIIDNGTSYLAQLKKLIDGLVDVISYSEIAEKNDEYFEQFNAIVLSGGHSFPVTGNETALQSEIYLIKNIHKPIFGICYGFELIAHTFGAKLEQLKNKEHGIIDIEVIQQNDIFQNILSFKVFESHRWVVQEPLDDLLVLAKSKNGVEAIKHKTYPIYAVQFHPEMFIDETCGDEIFNNFLNSLKVASSV